MDSSHLFSEEQDLFGLAPGGVYQAIPITRDTGELLPHLFTLTPWNRRHRHFIGRYLFCGTFLTLCEEGVTATSQGAVRVTDHPVLWSSDFPLPRLPSPGAQRGATLSSPSPPPFSFSCSTLLRIASLAKRSASLFCSLGTDSILKDENPRRSSIAAR